MISLFILVLSISLKTKIICVLFQIYFCNLFRPGSIIGNVTLDFSRPLSLVEQSKAMSEVSDLFMENPIAINGESMTVMRTPVYFNPRSNLTESRSHRSADLNI